jgi:hypothetical protein
MNIRQAKQLFEEIVELCYETENPRLIELIEDIYPEVEDTLEMARVKSAMEEIQVLINELDLTDDEEEVIQDIKEKIELLSE